jgi:hypothetical protein
MLRALASDCRPIATHIHSEAPAPLAKQGQLAIDGKRKGTIVWRLPV